VESSNPVNATESIRCAAAGATFLRQPLRLPGKTGRQKKQITQQIKINNKLKQEKS
jgi:hypothetical protein